MQMRNLNCGNNSMKVLYKILELTENSNKYKKKVVIHHNQSKLKLKIQSIVIISFVNIVKENSSQMLQTGIYQNVKKLYTDLSHH